MLERITDPVAEPISLALADQYLRAEGLDDALIEQVIIPAARDYCEKYCSRSFAQSTWRVTFPRFPGDARPLCIEDPGVTEVLSVAYLDSEGAAIELTGVTFDEVRRTITPSDPWPLYSTGIVVTYVAGPDFTSSPPPVFPKSLINAMLLVMGDMYENRTGTVIGTIVAANPAVVEQLTQYRVGWGI